MANFDDVDTSALLRELAERLQEDDLVVLSELEDVDLFEALAERRELDDYIKLLEQELEDMRFFRGIP